MNQPESIEELFENDPVAIKLHEAAYEMGKGDVFLQQAIKQGKCAFGYGDGYNGTGLGVHPWYDKPHPKCPLKNKKEG